MSLSKREVDSETSENQFFHSEFSILHYTQNPELKTSEFSLRHFDQIPRFSNSEFSISHHTQTENSELKTSAKVYPSNDFVHCPGRGLFDIWNGGANVKQFSQTPNLIRPSFSKKPNNQLSSFDTKTMAY